MNEQLKEAVSEAIREALGGALDCGRAWSAWGVGTMSEDDFSPVADDSERVAEIADAVLAALSAQPSPGGQGEVREQFEAWLDTLRLDRSRHGDGYVWNDVELAWRAVEKFAARQPVRIYGCCAQPEGELHTAECPNMRHLSARQPVYVQGCDELRARTEGERAAYMEGLEEGKKIAARQPVGAAVAYQSRHALGPLGGDGWGLWTETGRVEFERLAALIEGDPEHFSRLVEVRALGVLNG